jgi:hypothetical protein
VSYGFPIINFSNRGVHYETPCVNNPVKQFTSLTVLSECFLQGSFEGIQGGGNEEGKEMGYGLLWACSRAMKEDGVSFDINFRGSDLS